MQKVNDIEKVKVALPGANMTRFHQRNYEDGVRDALNWVLGQIDSREMMYYVTAAKLEKST